MIILSSVVIFLLILFSLLLFLIKPGKKRAQMAEYQSLKYAHRGLHNGERAENSLSAFSAAAEAGFAIELDVRLSADGELVVFHDDTLERMTNVSGRVDSKTADELSKICLGETTDTIPTFREVLELVDGRVPLLVEIKEDAGKYGVTEKTVEMLRNYKGKYIIESFNPLALSRVKKLMPEVLRGFLSQNFSKDKKYKGFTYFLLQNLLINFMCRPDFIAFNHTDYKMKVLRLVKKMFGVPTLAWTVRTEEEELSAHTHGFSGVIFEGYIPTK